MDKTVEKIESKVNEYNVYEDITARTKGDIYIGVVGPVRSGKSTFIKRFMDLIVIPQIEDENIKARTIDELPQSGNGKTIMTTEPKFVPKDAANIRINDNCSVNIKLIDCVGYLVEGATGHIEKDEERMVRTPWSEEPITFSSAAAIGTTKVINEHSTIGIVITTDGSFGELPRESFKNAEQIAIDKLKKLGKPFVVLLNSAKPYSKETLQLVNEMKDTYSTTVLPVNCLQLKKDDITNIMESILLEFKISRVLFNIPSWTKLLDITHPLKEELISYALRFINSVDIILDAINYDRDTSIYKYIERINIANVDLKTGEITVNIDLPQECYYDILTELTGLDIIDEYSLVNILKELADKRKRTLSILNATEIVDKTGYGVINPDIRQITISKPQIIKHANKYGIKIKAQSPSIHLISAVIETEIAPIVGTKEQAQDLIDFINEGCESNPENYWDINIFGKTIKQLVEEGMQSKINKMTEDTKQKMQQTLQKIINESNGSVICIIL